MTNFEVVYTYGENGEYSLPSRVYAVDPKDNTFLIVDGWGKFHWVRADRCVEKSVWENDNGPLLWDDDEEETNEEYAESAWDSYDRWVGESLKDN